MKFGKSLSNQMEDTLPEWRDQFLSYNDLKKRLKHIGPPSPTAGGERPAKRPRAAHPDDCGVLAPLPQPETMTNEEEDFIRLLEAELEKFNAFFVEKEEEYIIYQKELQDQVRMAASKEELMRVRKEIVDFHGEMVLLENYSALNYTGLVKILKKYDKRTGALMRLPFIQKVLQQPFFTTDLLYKLVKQCEVVLDQLFPKNEPSTSGNACEAENDGDQKSAEPGSGSVVERRGPGLEEIEYMESLYMKSTVAALRALKEIRSGSSTISALSLPPLQQNNGAISEQWSKSVPVLEEVAK